MSAHIGVFMVRAGVRAHPGYIIVYINGPWRSAAEEAAQRR